ncbi:M48 family metallopeptidase [Desulfovulcanus ferrireducens]|uniref:M48 family metallopeptidase n=1 Tax=Desulfovulcanus ferrireducens TaxID=2831190 RepID=UPI00207B9EB2|nr:SprT family zinc-dependent metalloprotease [Desulfovulcanus ferrireducens]
MSIHITKIIRSRRKTIALQVTEDATLIVRAPYRVGGEVLQKVVEKHKKWIEKKKKEIQARNLKFTPKEFVDGEEFFYLGRSYKLTIVDEPYPPLVFKSGFFLSGKYLPVARKVFIDWYKQQAYQKISERVEWYAPKQGFKYNKVNITNAQQRWGSCSSIGNLNFSWRLVMAPLPVIDYVVVHELVHLEERNHSKKFWDKVKVIMPGYEKYKDWLKKNSYLLRL